MAVIKIFDTNYKRGSILILSLWVILVLSIILIPIVSYKHRAIDLNRRIEVRHQLTDIAESAVKRAINYLRHNDDSLNYDSLKDAWVDNIIEFKNIGIGEGFATVSSIENIYGLVDEERKICINRADADVLKNILHSQGGVSEYEARCLADCILDWRDADNTPRECGAETTDYYFNLNPPYYSKNQDIELLEELLFVKGFTRQIYDNIYPFVTVYHSGRININTASEDVLLALGLLPPIVNDIVLFRRGPDGSHGTIDDGVFAKTDDIFVALGKEPEDDPVLFQLIQENKIGVISSHFRIEVEAMLPGRTTLAKKLICVVGRDGETHYSYGYFFHKE